MFLEFQGNNNGHYNIINIKNNIDIKKYIDNVPLIIDNKYNPDFLNKCYQHNFCFLKIIFKKQIIMIIVIQ